MTVTRYLPDVNVWLSLTLSGHAHHEPCRAWIDQVDEPGSILLCRMTQQGLLRLLTTAAVFQPYGAAPLSNEQAWAVQEQLQSDDRIVVVEEPVEVEGAWGRLARRRTSSPKLWMDAYLAAVAMTVDATVVTTDAAFRQFTGLPLDLLG